ncbi:Flp family type IVb pilin [Candidatus Schmidhempelia bombi]|uniref:Flp family type IVb pilin n=1 Tax=Candidatus Schmidhempelia bombi str. Bimp TaxID=1387197 RepID=A0AB94ICI4_9GAMM|nr:Flp family type IVb pilin [Candidatus Schmidhempelia bombi]TEA27127.1 Flp family type IVb pilin [Candidatus Schmidhempelia bombi str. Bimp]
MKNLVSNIRHFFNREDGVTAIEYAVVIAGVAVVTISAFSSGGPVRQALDNVFSHLQTTLNALS